MNQTGVLPTYPIHLHAYQGSSMAPHTFSPSNYLKSAMRYNYTNWESDPYLYEGPRSDLISPYMDHIICSPPKALSLSSTKHPSFSTNSSPITPLQALFSSPSTLWPSLGSSVSPVRRNGIRSHSRSANRRDMNSPPNKIHNKIQSLVAYQAAQDGMPSSSPVTQCLTDCLSPSLSALSSIPASPSKPATGYTRGLLPGNPDAANYMAARSPVAASTGSFDFRSAVLDSADRRAVREALGSRYQTRSRRQPVRVDPPNASSPPLFLSGGIRKRVAKDPEPEPTCLSAPLRKKRRHNTDNDAPSYTTIPTADTHAQDDKDTSIPRRTFPLHVPVNPEFPLFYRRFSVSSYHEGYAPKYAKTKGLSDATFNPPRDAFDLYTPRFVKGRGTTKVGLCPCCIENKARGGEDKRLWFSTKFSAFKCALAVRDIRADYANSYHMQYAHGISAMTGRPFSPPVAFRTVARATVGKLEKSELMQGKCHKCKKWVAVEGIKDVPTKVKEIYWWKHAASCHQGSVIEGECDIFIEDKVYATLLPASAACDLE